MRQAVRCGGALFNSLHCRVRWQPSLRAFVAAELRSAHLEAMGDRSGPSDKRRRISKLLSIRGVNVSMISQVVGILEDRAPPRAVVRRVQSRVAECVCTTIRLPLVDGTHFDWCVALPQQTLPYLYRECATFREAVGGAAEKQRWQMALYLDEVTPGNPLRPDNRRRMTAIYASMLEWGPFMRTEEGWLSRGHSHFHREDCSRRYGEHRPLAHGGAVLGTDELVH